MLIDDIIRDAGARKLRITLTGNDNVFEGRVMHCNVEAGYVCLDTWLPFMTGKGPLPVWLSLSHIVSVELR